jgi:hypothetical protein
MVQVLRLEAQFLISTQEGPFPSRLGIQELNTSRCFSNNRLVCLSNIPRPNALNKTQKAAIAQ